MALRDFCSLFSNRSCAHMKGLSKTFSQLVVLICLVSLRMSCHPITFTRAWSGYFGWDKSCPGPQWLTFLSIKRLLSQAEMPHGSQQLITQVDSAWLCFDSFAWLFWVNSFDFIFSGYQPVIAPLFCSELVPKKKRICCELHQRTDRPLWQKTDHVCLDALWWNPMGNTSLLRKACRWKYVVFS